MRSRRKLLVAALALLIGPATALTQIGAQPGGGQPGGGGGFRGMMNMDPNERWNQMTGGKDVWVRSQITDQRQQFFFDMIARQLNVTNGQVTKQQFLDFSEQMRQRFQNSGGGAFGRGGFGGGMRGNAQQAGGNASAPAGPGGGTWNPDAMAEVLFRRYDKNGDGVLNYDEMPDNLKAEKDKWDKNKDGLIDLNEFKEFVRARADQIRNEMGIANAPGGAPGVLPMLPSAPEREVEEPKKVVVYRAGKLPKDLPAWFAQLDRDGDGQIGLYEWKKGWQMTGHSFDDFFKMDRNGDGFLTVEEVLRYQADQNKKNGTTTASSGPSPGSGGQPQGGFAGPGNGGNQFRQPRDGGQFRQGGNGPRGPRGEGGQRQGGRGQGRPGGNPGGQG